MELPIEPGEESPRRRPTRSTAIVLTPVKPIATADKVHSARRKIKFALTFSRSLACAAQTSHNRSRPFVLSPESMNHDRTSGRFCPSQELDSGTAIHPSPAFETTCRHGRGEPGEFRFAIRPQHLAIRQFADFRDGPRHRMETQGTRQTTRANSVSQSGSSALRHIDL